MRRLYAVIFFLLVLSCLSGCSRSAEPLEEGEASYQIYYLNSGMTKLVPVEYRTRTTDTQQLIQELMEQFVAVPNDIDCQTALSDKVKYQKIVQEDMILYLYFDNNYTNSHEMKTTREILCRTALVKTMTQVPGIEYISIYVADQPLLDSSGIPVGLLSASDFVESVSDVNAFEKSELTLYFTDESGERLYPEKREVVHNINRSMERLLLEELISGPKTEGLYPTISKDTKLLSVSVTDNVCYLNFDTAFLSSPSDVKDYVTIYSIVNTLTELNTVNKVQITVNGSQDVMFKDSISLDATFEKNTEIGGDVN